MECRSLSSILTTGSTPQTVRHVNSKNLCCVQMQELLQGGMQKLEQHPDHQEDVPTRPELTDLLANAHKLLQLKEAGNRWVSCCLEGLSHSYGSFL